MAWQSRPSVRHHIICYELAKLISRCITGLLEIHPLIQYQPINYALQPLLLLSWAPLTQTISQNKVVSRAIFASSMSAQPSTALILTSLLFVFTILHWNMHTVNPKQLWNTSLQLIELNTVHPRTPYLTALGNCANCTTVSWIFNWVPANTLEKLLKLAIIRVYVYQNSSELDCTINMDIVSWVEEVSLTETQQSAQCTNVVQIRVASPD